MKKDKLKRMEKEIENKSIKGLINYKKLESGKYIAINTNDRKAALNELEYIFEGGKINPENIFNSVSEIKARYGSDFEYNDLTKVLEEF